MISAMTSSTTLRVLEKGALKTATPRRVAAARSIWLVPMQNAPTASSRGDLSSTASVTWVRDRIPSRSIVPDAVDQLALVVGAGVRLHVEAGLVEAGRRAGMDVLQQDGPAAGGTSSAPRACRARITSGERGVLAGPGMPFARSANPRTKSDEPAR